QQYKVWNDLQGTGPPAEASTGLYGRIKRDHEACISLKAALLIQTWYRRYQAELEMRRRCAWKIYEFFEYTGADDQRHLKEFFTWILSNYSRELYFRPSWPTAKTRSQSKSIFSQSLQRHLQKVSIAGKENARWKNSTIRFHETHEHSHFNNDYIQSLIEFQKQGKLLDSELVTEVLEEATTILQTLPNIQRASTTLSQRITVCGDLHGQNGLPDIFNPYIFNGDFVDRGNNSIEVLVILLSCLLAHPSAVFLNRGNHEDPMLNKRYGFADEVRTKYPKQYKKILKQTELLFCTIPLCTILDDVILVCHGGISRTTDLAKVTKLDRKMFTSVLQPPLEGEKAVSIDDWRQVLDILWSDPQSASGCKPNIKRGGGSHFGPDITANLLTHLKIGVLIRSHECCPNGWKMDHNNQDQIVSSTQVLTVFSASNYYGTDSNLGAFIQLSSKRVVGTARAETRISIMEPVECELNDLPTVQVPAMGDESLTIATSTNTSARITYTRVTTSPENGEETEGRHRQIVETLLVPRLVTFRAGRSNKQRSLLGNRNSNDAAYRMLLRRILSHKESIVAALYKYDPQQTGEVTITQWCTVMLKHAGQNLPWRILRYSLVKPSRTHPKTHVLYMSMFDPKHEIFSDSIKQKFTSENYADLDELVSIFKQFDNANNASKGVALILGFVSVEDFKEKCKKLYTEKGFPSTDSNISKLAMLLDFNSDGIIDFNEFIEGSRLMLNETMATRTADPTPVAIFLRARLEIINEWTLALEIA
ncbi:Serine/threonine-protein phosphatase with EF-hand pef-1, partial [Taenia solium]